MKSKLFGTDGIRGKANQYPMTAEIAMKFAIAAGSYLKQKGYRNKVLIAKDTRLSGYMIETALVSGFVSVGIDVTMVGPVPTPAVSMLLKSLRTDMGVMITASHNPYYDNGLKLFNSNGEKLTDACQQKIEDIMQLDINSLLVSADELGRAKRLDDVQGRYIEHVKYSFAKQVTLNNIRIVLDCANGSAYNIAPSILWELGAEVVMLGCSPNGFNINQDCGAMYPNFMAQKVQATRADIGIALDGDADRLIISDENGYIIDGDYIIALIATYLAENNKLQNNAVAITQMSNGALDEYLLANSIKTYRTRVGDRYVFDKMKQHDLVLGGEQSGHIIYSKYANTGDGLVAALQVLSVLITKKIKASSIRKLFALKPQILKNIRFHDNNPLDNQDIITAINTIINAHLDKRIMVRKSGTEQLIRIMVEGNNADNIKLVAQDLAQKLLI